MDVEWINQVWGGDITCIPLPNTFAYLNTQMVLYSRKIIGGVLDLNMEAALVNDALRHAIKARRPSKPLIHYTDQADPYTGTKYRRILASPKMLKSMSRVGDCYDSALMERCFGTIKTE